MNLDPPPQITDWNWIWLKWISNLFAFLEATTVTTKGTLTMDADASTTVADTSVTTTARITITPTNAAAATLTAGSSSPFVTNKVANTSFDVNTADAGNAGGTETFDYLILN